MSSAFSLSVENLANALAAANLSRSSNPNDAVAKYFSILDAPLPTPLSADATASALLLPPINASTPASTPAPVPDSEDDVFAHALRLKESALVQLARLLSDSSNASELANLFTRARSFLILLPKARTARLVRSLIDLLAEIPNSLPVQIAVCRDAISWADSEKRAYLRQALETRLAAMYLDQLAYTDALALIARLLSELKRLDDKPSLIDVLLLESRVYLAVHNIPKAKAALTSARTAANAVYCPPLQQAALDLQAGILNAEDGDFKTAYSYFYETFEGYSTAGDSVRALLALRYMLLSKILLSSPSDVASLLHLKITAPYLGRETMALKAIADAMVKRNLRNFEIALSEYNDVINTDPVVSRHLERIHNELLEQNLLRVVEPFSRVEIAHVAHLMYLPIQKVELKLSQLILDGKIRGILDQGTGVLETFDEQKSDETFTNAIETLKRMGCVVQSLYQKAAML